MSFRGKIFLSVALPAVALVSLLAFAAYLYVRRQADLQADVDVARARGSFDQQLKRRIGEIERSCAPFDSGKFRAVIEENVEDPAALAGEIKSVQRGFFMQIPFYSWADAEGRILFRQVKDADHFCGPDCRHAEVALFGQERNAILETELGLCVVHVDFLSDQIQVAAGVEFAGDVAEIARSSGIEIAVLLDGRLVHSTLAGLSAAGLRGAGEIPHEGTNYRFAGVRELNAVFVPLVPMAARDRQVALIWRGAMGSIGVAVFISLLVALAVSRSIAGPVLELEAASRKIGEGDLDVAVDIRSKDELGRLGAAFNGMVQGLRERVKRAEIMTKMLSKEVSEKLMGEELALTGRQQTATILFLDVRGFTSMTEGRDAPWVFDVVNQCLGHVEKHIRARGGVVNKYLGDGAMALFGVPESKGNDALHAIEAARDIQRDLAEWNRQREARGDVPVRVGIGINTDEVLAGNVGSADRMEFTVIGEGVNLASRLCSKAQPGQVLASHATRRDAGVEGRELEPVHVKGFSAPIRVYEV